jgi:hypothetical protein
MERAYTKFLAYPAAAKAVERALDGLGLPETDIRGIQPCGPDVLKGVAVELYGKAPEYAGDISRAMPECTVIGYSNGAPECHCICSGGGIFALKWAPPEDREDRDEKIRRE